MHGNKYGSGSEGAWLEEEDFSLEKLSYTSRPAPNQFNKHVGLVKQYFKQTSEKDTIRTLKLATILLLKADVFDITS